MGETKPLWLNDGSRMNGDVHVRFRESLGVKFPRATHPPGGAKAADHQTGERRFTHYFGWLIEIIEGSHQPCFTLGNPRPGVRKLCAAPASIRLYMHGYSRAQIFTLRAEGAMATW